jgi:hypothetical protein
MVPYTGRYEERYRLTNVVFPLLALVFALFGIITGFWPFFVVAVVGVLLYILTVTVYRVAFRADSAGITFGVDPMRFKFYAVHIPWPDIEMIILYTIRERPSGPPGMGRFPKNERESSKWIGIKRRAGAPALAHGNQPSNCPDPSVPAGATRPIGGWRLDRGRLAAVIAVAAPDVRLVDDGTTDLTDFMKGVLRSLPFQKGIGRMRGCGRSKPAPAG